MNVRSLLLAGGLGSVFGGVTAVLLLPFAVGQRLKVSGSAGECWVSVAATGFLVVFSTNDPVFLSSCGLLILADLSRQQPMVCLLYTSPSPRDQSGSRMPSSA